MKNLERQEVRDWLQNTRDILTEEKKVSVFDHQINYHLSKMRRDKNISLLETDTCPMLLTQPFGSFLRNSKIVGYA